MRDLLQPNAQREVDVSAEQKKMWHDVFRVFTPTFDKAAEYGLNFDHYSPYAFGLVHFYVMMRDKEFQEKRKKSTKKLGNDRTLMIEAQKDCDKAKLHNFPLSCTVT